jgi:transcription elongation factor Elf1
MEYILGSIITLITLYVANKKLSSNKDMKLRVNVSYNQTRAHELVRPLNIFNEMIDVITKKNVTQTTKHEDSIHIKVVIADNEAYWISDNKFYVADVRDMMVVQESARIVDTMTMDDVQLKKISEIVEILREEDNHDRRGPGNKKL